MRHELINYTLRETGHALQVGASSRIMRLQWLRRKVSLKFHPCTWSHEMPLDFEALVRCHR